jgi:hypothetical protein
MRARFFPGASAALAALADAIISLAAAVVISECLGVVGLFRMLPVVVGFGLGGTAMAVYARRPSSAHGEVGGELVVVERSGHVLQVVAVGVVAVVVGEWSARTIAAVRNGPSSLDPLWYHLPAAARFVQTHSLAHIQYFDTDNVTAFYPFDGSVFHALGMLFLGSDILSPLLNMGFLALALLAGWCIGESAGSSRSAAASMIGVAAVVSLPLLTTNQPGQGMNDIMAVAFLLAAVALLLASDLAGAFGSVEGAALASGLAVGTKYTLVIPIGALTVGVFVLAMRRRRTRDLGAWVLGVGLAGGFWYARNVVAVGNPIPQLHLGPLPTLPSRTPTSTLAPHLFDGAVRDTLAATYEFGRTWWALLLLAGIGIAWGIVALEGAHRLAAIVAGVAVVGFVFQPQILANANNPTAWLGSNLRYLTPGLALGMAVLPTIPFLARGARTWLPIIGSGSIVFLSQHGMWKPLNGIPLLLGHRDLVGGIVFGTGSAAALFVGSRGFVRRAAFLRFVTVFALLATFIYAFLVYRDAKHAILQRQSVVHRWVSTIRDARIGVVGRLDQYRLYGDDLSNFVQYLAVPMPGGGVRAFATCGEWRQAVNDGEYSYIVERRGFTLFADTTPPPSWTVNGQDASIVLHYGPTWVFRLHRQLDLTKCPVAPTRD